MRTVVVLWIVVVIPFLWGIDVKRLCMIVTAEVSVSFW